MDAQNIGPVHSQERSKGDRWQKAIVDRAVVPANFAKKGFARHADDDRAIVDAQAGQIFQEREIMLERLSEPDSRIERERHWIKTEFYGAGILLSKKIGYIDNDIVIKRRALHCWRSSFHVHDDEGRAAFGQQRPHRVVPPSAGYIIHDFRARIQSRGCDFRLRGIDRNQGFAGELFDYRKNATFFFSHINWFGARAGRFSADIDDVSTIGDHFSSLGQRLRSLKKSAAIGKRIRGHIQDTHDPAAGREIENLARNFPWRHTHMGETTTRSELFEAQG